MILRSGYDKENATQNMIRDENIDFMQAYPSLKYAFSSRFV